MGMYYSIELKNDDTSEYIKFPNVLSYFFEQVGGYGEKSIVSQVEKILNIDLSIFQKTYNPEMDLEFDEEPEALKNDIYSEELWIDIDSLLQKLNEFLNKIENNKNCFSQVILNPIDDTNKIMNMDYDTLILYQEENPLTLYPIDNGIVTEMKLRESVTELIKTLKELKTEDKIRLVYG